MAVRRVQLRRGSTAENDAFTGAIGEITVDTQTNTVRVHDGATAGGQDLLRTDMANNEDITSDLNVTGSITIGPALGAETITLGQANSTITIPGTLNVATQNTTNDLLIQDKVIVLADGSEANAHANDSIGLIFTRPLSAGANPQDPGLMYWDEVANRFVLSTNNVTEADAVWNGGTPTALLLGALDLNDGNITNVGNIALDSISPDAGTDTISIDLLQAGAGSALVISDDGAVNYLTIDTTNGSDKLTLAPASFEISADTNTSILGNVVINEGGVDKDFRVEGTGKINALFVQGSDGFVGINNGAPTAQLEVTGTSKLDGAVSINETRADVDFNVAASNAVAVTNALFVQGSDGFVGINNGEPSFNLDVIGTSAFSSTARFSGDVDIRTHLGTNGITFNKGAADQNTTLLRMDRAGNFSTLTWSAATSRFVFNADLQISSADLVLGNGANATSISVPNQTDLNTAGENLTVSAGIGNGTGAGGSLIFQTGGDNAGALSTVLTLDKDNLATFTGDIDVSAGTTIGASVGAGDTLTLGGNVTSTVITAGDLTVTGETINSSTASALQLTGSDVEVIGDLTVTGNDIKQSTGDAVITFSGDGNKTATFSGNISVTSSITTDTDLNVSGGDVILGDGSNPATISVTTQTDGDTAGENLTVSAGIGNGTGAGGSLIFQTGGDNGGALTTVLTLDKDNLATFTGDIDVSDGTTIGASVGAGHTLTLGGDATSTVITAGDLTVTGNTINSSTGVAFELSGTDVEVRGDLTVTGNDISGSGGVALSITNADVEVKGDLTVTGNDLIFGNGATVVNTDANTLTITEALTALSGNLKVGGNVIQDSTGQSTLTFSGADATLLGDLTISGNDLTFGNGATVVNTDANTLTITEALTALSGNLRVGGNVIQDSTGQSTLTLSGDNATLAGDLTVGGDDIRDSAGTASITFSGDSDLTTLTAATTALTGNLKLGTDVIQDSTGQNTLTLSGANATLLGDLTISGNDLIFGNGATVVNTDANTLTITEALTALSGNLKVGGNVIQASGGQSTLTLSGANATLLGDLTIQGQDLVLGTATAGDTTISVPDHGTLNTAGHDLTISAGRGNGTGDGGSLVFRTGGNAGGAIANVLTLDTDKLANFSGSVEIAGDLTVNGTTTTIDTTQLVIEDPVILLNKNADADGVAADRDLGIFMERRAQDAALLYWDEGDDTFLFCTTTAEASTDDFAGTTTLQAVRALSFEMDGGDFIVDTANEDFKVDQNGVLTSKNTASFDVDSETGLVISKNAGVDVALRVDTTNLDVETSDLLPLANSTYDIGTNANRYAVGYFDDLQATTQTVSGALTLQGVVTYSNADAIEITTGVTNGITFRSEIAGAGADGNATLIRVNSGAEGYRSILWNAGTDEFSVQSGLNSVGDFGVGTIGAENFVVSAGTGSVKIEGDITTDTDEAKNIFSAVTTEGNLITLGGGATVKTAGKLRVTGNEIEDSGNATVITFDGSQNTTLAGDLTVDGNTINSSGGVAFELSGTDVEVRGDLTVTGADVILGANANGTPTTLAPVARSGANDLAGNTLTVKGGQSTGTGAGGSIAFQTSETGGVSNNVQNAYQTVLTLDTDKLASFTGAVDISTTLTVDSTSTLTGDVTFGGHIVADADEAKNIFSAVTTEGNLITLGGGGTVKTAGKLRVTGNEIEDSGDLTVITFDGSQNTTFTGDVTVSGGDVTLGNGANATTISVTTQTDLNTAGENLTISAGRGNGTGTGGSLIFQTGGNAGGALSTVLTLDSANKATFTGELEVASNLILGNNIIQNSDGESTITLDANQKVTLAGDLDVTGVITGNSAVASSLRFKDPTLYVGYTNAATTRDVGFVGAYGDSNFADYLMGVVYEVDGAAGGKDGAFKIFHGRADVTEPNLSYSVPDGDLAPIHVGGVSAVSTINVFSESDNAGPKTAILLNSDQTGTPDNTEDVSITVERGDETNASITWDEGDERFTMDNGTGASNFVVTTAEGEGARVSLVDASANGGGGDIEFTAGNVLDLTASAPSAWVAKKAYFLDNGATAGDVELWELASSYNGLTLIFYNEGTANITLNAQRIADGAAADETVDGGATLVLGAGATVTLLCKGTNYYVI